MRTCQGPRIRRVTLGATIAHPVRRLRWAATGVDEATRRSARLEGFSLHANVAVPAHARERLEHVCRDLLRPPLALERVTERSHGQLLHELPRPRADGATPLLLDPLELIEKVAVLVPAPRVRRRDWLIGDSTLKVVGPERSLPGRRERLY